MRKSAAFGSGRVYVIAEAGVNHNGSLELALQLIDRAAEAGADAVKFQTFRADDLATVHAPKAGYQVRTTGAKESQLEMLKKLQIGASAHRTLLAHCRRRSIDFLSSAFDATSLRLLTDTLRLPILKIPSGEITNGPLLLQAGRSGRRIILSTGMSTLAEIESALGVLAFGLSGSALHPSKENFAAAYRSSFGQRRLREKVVILHCVTDYPTRFEDVNLRAMDTLRAAFGVPVGLSDHSLGIAVPIAAVARDACVIEKHVTLDRKLPGPDHGASLEPGELKAMVAGIREVESAMGTGLKLPSAAELQHVKTARKTIVAARDIRRGERYSSRNLAAKRAGQGRSPLEIWELIGKQAPRRFRKDEPVE
jgi:N-acetylneuraminate synthase